MNRQWDAQIILEQWLENHQQKKPLTSFDGTEKEPIYLYRLNEAVPLKELENTVLIAAQLVQELGEDYIGIFERAERELAKAKQNLSTMERIRNLAKPNVSTPLSSRFKSNFIKPNSLLFQAWSCAVSGPNVFMSH